MEEHVLGDVRHIAREEVPARVVQWPPISLVASILEKQAEGVVQVHPLPGEKAESRILFEINLTLVPGVDWAKNNACALGVVMERPGQEVRVFILAVVTREPLQRSRPHEACEQPPA